MNIYSMAKTIMIADRIYEELKKVKGTDKSFSEVIAEALEKSNEKKKTIGNLREFAGVFEGDTEYDEAFKWLKKAEKISDDRIWKKLR